MLVVRIAGLWILDILASISSIMYIVYIEPRDTRIIAMQTLILLMTPITLTLLHYSYRCLSSWHAKLDEDLYRQIYEDAGRAAVQSLQLMLEQEQAQQLTSGD